MIITPAITNWLNWVVITSQPLRRYDANAFPIGFGSAAIVEYAGRRFLLSVAHVVNNDESDWVMDIGHDPKIGPGQETWRPRSFVYAGEANHGTEVTGLLDFCYAELPSSLKSFYQYRSLVASGKRRLRHVFRSDLSTLPNVEDVYAFAGEVNPAHLGSNIFCTDMVIFPGLKYLRTENEMHVFKLPVEHPGHSEFKGCSGAPIVDMKKRIVALVCKGDEEQGLVYGISVTHCKPFLDFLCNVSV
ncbi:hypothetical protein ACO0LL_18320 [Undibacterium sp. TC4M20W]|uniref:hypothetical protein n=1 Tax=unclassified Undibacterium TaxID=2630295 RepID=UPI003BF2EEBA